MVSHYLAKLGHRHSGSRDMFLVAEEENSLSLQSAITVYF